MKLQRLYQDDHFKMDEFNGQKIKQLIAVEVPETKSICLVYIKVENHYWHRFSLDTGFAVWENCGEQHIDLEDDSYNYIDKATELNILDKEISEIVCEPIENHCQIKIQFSNSETIILKPVDFNDYESESELINLKE